MMDTVQILFDIPWLDIPAVGKPYNNIVLNVKSGMVSVWGEFPVAEMVK